MSCIQVLQSCAGDIIWSQSVQYWLGGGATVRRSRLTLARPNQKHTIINKLIIKMSTWTDISVIRTTLYDRNHLWKRSIRHALRLLSLSHVPSANMEGVGLMTYTAASQMGAIKTFWLHFWGAFTMSIVFTVIGWDATYSSPFQWRNVPTSIHPNFWSYKKLQVPGGPWYAAWFTVPPVCVGGRPLSNLTRKQWSQFHQ